MNERIWEGVIQVLRPDDSPLTATARLWRRDDFFGTDWGGQLEIPIALRRALPPGEYTVVLGPDREAVAFIGLGPSNAASTFPTLTGTGAPPFGAPVPDHEESEDAAQVEETAAEPATGPTETPVELPTPARAQSKPKRATRSTATPKPRQAAAVKTASIEQEPVVSEVAAVGADISPVPAQSIPLEVPIMGLNASNGASAGPIGQTEHLARAFLTAVESRDRLLAVDASGVEAQLLAALQDLSGPTPPTTAQPAG